jgi:hypothetical protein
MKIRIILFFILIITCCKSQSLQRQTIAGGDYMLVGNVLIQQTIGQPYTTISYYDADITYRPGFQQPIFQSYAMRPTMKLKVFPNPSSSVVTVESFDVMSDIVVTISDILGKTIISQKFLRFKKCSFNCDILSDGIYLICVSDKIHTYTLKLIVAK